MSQLKFTAFLTASPRLWRAVLCLMMALAPSLAEAQSGKLRLIRDAEIEQLIREYATPVLQAAGVNAAGVEIYILNENSFNAFVIDGRRMFINTGAITQSKTPNEIIGVIAHETGHIAGGHNARLRSTLANAKTAALVGMLLGVGAVAAGAAAGDAGTGAAAGQAVISGSQSAVMRTVLSYQRSEEAAADRAAVRYLNATGQSARGMIQTFQRFADQAIVTLRNVDPYVMSHPMARERVSALQQLAQQSKYFDRKDPPALQLRHDLARAKLYGFMERPGTVLRRYPPSDKSLPARYARAITSYLNDDLRVAIRDIDGLIKEQPQYPYFWELKGQALLEGGRGREAVAPLRKAVSLYPNSGLIRMILGQALLASGNVDGAISELSKALEREPEASIGWRQLAMAYGQKGDIARAEMASARSSFAAGDFKLAQHHAARVQRKVPKGSPLWVQADDILNYKPPKTN